MFYSSGNYEAFVHPHQPQGVENKTAWSVGAGLAALAGGAFPIRDGQIPGNRITLPGQQLEPGGALDGIKEPEKGFVIRGGREMEDHFECLWDLYRPIPSLKIEGVSVLAERDRLDIERGAPEVFDSDLRQPHAAGRVWPPARWQQGDRRAGPRVRAHPSDEETRQAPKRRATAGVQADRGRLS